MRPLNKNVYRLGLLSLFNDFTADMITPLLPVFLMTLGFGSVALGAMEGTANCFSYLTMLLAGSYVDRHGKNKKVTLLGYSICAFARPFIAIPFFPITFLVRVVDRIGKGIRTAPRDTLMTSLTEKKDWGRGFGVQRAMDHSGSLIGSALAAWLISRYSLHLPTLFLIASVPAILSILFVPRKIPEIANKPRLPSASLSWRNLPRSLKPYIFIIFFAAFTSPSELFLLLKMKELGMPEYFMPIAWFSLTFFSLIAAYLGGHLADRWSRRYTIALGWLIFAIVYVGFAYNAQIVVSWVLLALYGIQAGLVEAAERTYPIHLADEKIRATALGWYYFAYGVGLLPASFLFGILWEKWSPQNAFLLYAGLTLISVFLVRLLPSSRPAKIEGLLPPVPGEIIRG
ncbi:MAG: MFS transporter [bacterium]